MKISKFYFCFWDISVAYQHWPKEWQPSHGQNYTANVVLVLNKTTCHRWRRVRNPGYWLKKMHSILIENVIHPKNLNFNHFKTSSNSWRTELYIISLIASYIFKLLWYTYRSMNWNISLFPHILTMSIISIIQIRSQGYLLFITPIIPQLRRVMIDWFPSLDRLISGLIVFCPIKQVSVRRPKVSNPHASTNRLCVHSKCDITDINSSYFSNAFSRIHISTLFNIELFHFLTGNWKYLWRRMTLRRTEWQFHDGTSLMVIYLL